MKQSNFLLQHKTYQNNNKTRTDVVFDNNGAFLIVVYLHHIARRIAQHDFEQVLLAFAWKLRDLHFYVRGLFSILERLDAAEVGVRRICLVVADYCSPRDFHLAYKMFFVAFQVAFESLSAL